MKRLKFGCKFPSKWLSFQSQSTDLQVLLEPKAYKRQVAYFESIGFDITTPPPVSGKETPLGDIFTLSNAVEPPPELWGDDDDAEAVEC